jgi:hypothetical protein
MTNPSMSPLDDARLLVLEKEVLSRRALSRSGADSRAGDSSEAVSPAIAIDLIGNVRTLRHTLSNMSNALEAAGYTHEAYLGLDATERNAPIWRAIREMWETTGKAPRYILRFAGSARRGPSTFTTPEAALEAAIESLEMCEGYPDAIELEGGGRLMDCAAILQAWQERHDPG